MQTEASTWGHSAYCSAHEQCSDPVSDKVAFLQCHKTQEISNNVNQLDVSSYLCCCVSISYRSHFSIQTQHTHVKALMHAHSTFGSFSNIESTYLGPNQRVNLLPLLHLSLVWFSFTQKNVKQTKTYQQRPRVNALSLLVGQKRPGTRERENQSRKKNVCGKNNRAGWLTEQNYATCCLQMAEEKNGARAEHTQPHANLQHLRRFDSPCVINGVG